MKWEICNICERKKTETCENCKYNQPMYLFDKAPDYFLLNRHFTIIEMIDKYCEITENCENCKAKYFCELYVMPDLIKKVTKIKNNLQQEDENKKITNKGINF